MYIWFYSVILGKIKKEKYEYKENRGKRVPWKLVEITFGVSFHIDKRKELKEVIAQGHSQV